MSGTSETHADSTEHELERGTFQRGVTATTPVDISFSDVFYSIQTGQKDKRADKVILNGLSGRLRPGTMTAIMGPTGSGKTSLLNVLATRMPVAGGATLKGSFSVNGEALGVATRRFARLSAYVMQDDALMGFLTVRETLGLAASFQLPQSATEEMRTELVRATIAELGLNKVADSLVGSETVRGVSGGERKRANIGVELIKNPSALFLDEPTSGLDSFQAQSVMECLAGLASQGGRTVVASIHQPRSSIFALFDQLYLISEGKCMFAGPASDAVAYFAQMGSQFACPAHFNPADWFLDLTSPDYRGRPGQELESLAQIDRFAQSWKAHAAAQEAGDGAWEAGLGGDMTGPPWGEEAKDDKNGRAACAAAGALPDEEEDEPLPTYQSPWARQVRFAVSSVEVLEAKSWRRSLGRRLLLAAGRSRLGGGCPEVLQW